jgi:hypothetical protein
VIRSLRFGDVSTNLKLDDRFLPTPKDVAQARSVGFTHATLLTAYLIQSNFLNPTIKIKEKKHITS